MFQGHLGFLPGCRPNEAWQDPLDLRPLCKLRLLITHVPNFLLELLNAVYLHEELVFRDESILIKVQIVVERGKLLQLDRRLQCHNQLFKFLQVYRRICSAVFHRLKELFSCDLPLRHNLDKKLHTTYFKPDIARLLKT